MVCHFCLLINHITPFTILSFVYRNPALTTQWFCNGSTMGSVQTIPADRSISTTPAASLALEVKWLSENAEARICWFGKPIYFPKKTVSQYLVSILNSSVEDSIYVFNCCAICQTSWFNYEYTILQALPFD